jgi:hypothetical protein
MSNFENFIAEYNKHYTDTYEFIEDLDCKIIKSENLKCTILQDLRIEQYDSYGNGNHDLGYVLQFPYFDNLIVKITGKYESYNGEEWYDFKEVFPKKVEVTIYE